MSNKVDKRRIAYTSYAPSYDAQRFEGRQNEYRERIRFRALLSAVGRRAFDRRVLDVGCGTGRGEVLLARAGFRNITAVDFTESMLQLAREKAATLCDDGVVKYVRADAYSLPFASASFDLVISLRFVHMFNFSLQQEIVKELARVCKPGGIVAVELSSIHKGFFVSRYLEQRRVKSHQKFNSIREVRQMFSRDLFLNYRVTGALLPKASTVFQHWPAFGERFESIAWVPPFNWLSDEIVVSGRRCDQSG